MSQRNLAALVAQMVNDRTFRDIAVNPRIQFGTPAKRYLGATILPERLVPNNEYVEESIKYRSPIANHGTRYSPVQLKGGALVGSFRVSLGNSDTGSELTSEDYDALISLLRQAPKSLSAMASLVRFAERTLVIPLVERNEKDRWDALVSAQVIMKGNNGFRDTINYTNPSGHRVAAADNWSDDTYDPFTDIYAMVNMQRGKGLITRRLITSYAVVAILMQNAKVMQRTSRLTITGGVITAQEGQTNLSSINEALARDGLPPIELYDEQYQTQSGTARFMPADVMVGIAGTERTEDIDLGDRILQVGNTLGYVGVGRPAGQDDPGRVVLVTPFENKPPRVEGESWQTSGPVVTEPEAVFVITSIS